MRINRRAVVGLGLVAGAAMAAPAEAQTPGVLEVAGDPAGRYAAAFEDIRAYGAQHMAAYGLPGLTVSIVGPDGLTAFLRFGHGDLDGRGPIRPDQLFQIGSISKSFTALCVFKLVDAGQLSLDADVRKLLPDLPLPSDGPLTVQSLLNHGSGLPDDAPIFPRGGDGRLWRGFAPGTHWSYSNLGFALLSELVERVSGRPFADYLQAEILTPLSMAATRPAILTGERALYAASYAPFYGDRAFPRAGPLGPGPWTDMTEGSGCVASTAADMARYARYLISAGSGRGAPLLSDAAALHFCQPTIDAPGWAVKGAKYANGLAVVPVEDRALLHHTGGMLSFNSAIHVDPIAGVGAFASTNVGLISYRPRELTAYACARLRAVVDGRPAPKPVAVPPKASEAGDVLNRYVGAKGEVLVVTASPRGLTATLAGKAVEMEIVDEDAFIAVDPAATPFALVFRRSAKTVTRAWWGEVEYVREGQTFTPPTSAAVRALTGHYGNDDPWRGAFHVLAQGEALYLDGTARLTPLPGGAYRIGDEDWSPERLWFEAPAGGRPQRIVISGVDYLRRP
ncbi:serine hydrolase domain-containing protein [Phenylobacterium aquaticum]|uniref:serine hydrolase domain-containing protein n=1 Tax=Phenylobacterium aquaticum TaxID=1763816 RepID=UPI001F5D8E50|nr:serine hydrolase domain-containing protein [Phenylobacterium aquaticum]MCI3131382.1 beta-lactamase family protein [Phenylobacterium aquaticum]